MLDIASNSYSHYDGKFENISSSLYDLSSDYNPSNTSYPANIPLENSLTTSDFQIVPYQNPLTVIDTQVIPSTSPLENTLSVHHEKKPVQQKNPSVIYLPQDSLADDIKNKNSYTQRESLPELTDVNTPNTTSNLETTVQKEVSSQTKKTKRLYFPEKSDEWHEIYDSNYGKHGNEKAYEIANKVISARKRNEKIKKSLLSLVGLYKSEPTLRDSESRYRQKLSTSKNKEKIPKSLAFPNKPELWNELYAKYYQAHGNTDAQKLASSMYPTVKAWREFKDSVRENILVKEVNIWSEYAHSLIY